MQNHSEGGYIKNTGYREAEISWWLRKSHIISPQTMSLGENWCLEARTILYGLKLKLPFFFFPLRKFSVFLNTGRKKKQQQRANLPQFTSDSLRLGLNVIAIIIHLLIMAIHSWTDGIIYKQKNSCASHFIRYWNFTNLVSAQGHKFTKENALSAMVDISLIFFHSSRENNPASETQY